MARLIPHTPGRTRRLTVADAPWREPGTPRAGLAAGPAPAPEAGDRDPATGGSRPGTSAPLRVVSARSDGAGHTAARPGPGRGCPVPAGVRAALTGEGNRRHDRPGAAGDRADVVRPLFPHAAPRVSGSLALASEAVPGGPVRVPAGTPVRAAGARLRVVPAPVPDPPGRLSPDAAARARAEGFMRVVVEVLAGTRPSAQLARCTTAGVLPVVHNLARFTRLFCHGRPQLYAHHVVGLPADGVTEGSAHLRLDGMPLLVAFRLERDATHRRASVRQVPGAWLCTVFQHADLRGLPAAR